MDRCIFVLGMHRSGTSLLTRVLNLCGGALPEDLKPADPIDNPAGYWESEEVVSINDAILAQFGLHYMEYMPLPEGFEEQVDDGLLERIERVLLLAHNAEGPLVIKDPRTSRTFPVWQRVARQLEVSVSSFVVMRAPGEVVSSLCKRDEALPQADAGLFWTAYTLDAMRHSEGVSREIVRYARILEDPKAAVSKICAFAELLENTDQAALDFVQPNLKRSDDATWVDPFDTCTHARALYTAVSEGKDWSAETTAFSNTVTQLEAFRRRDMAYLQDLIARSEELYSLAENRWKKIEQLVEVADERLATIRELDGALQRLRIDLEERSAQLYRAQAELDSLRVQARQHEERSAQLHRAQAELDNLRVQARQHAAELEAFSNSGRKLLRTSAKLVGRRLKRRFRGR